MKKIAIIGGGISGLCVLHYLKQHLGDGAHITLFEREATTGGTIRSFQKDSCLFEWGPNGFLDNQPATLQLIEELGLRDQLIEADNKANRRYIQIKEKLYPVPSGFPSFIQTPLIPLKDKWTLVKGLFKKNVSTDNSIYNYISQRFSPLIAETLIDPFISGISAGDIKRLHMASAFPKFKRKGFKKPCMLSFKGGMGTITEALAQRYKKYIQTDSEILSIPSDNNITILATPAYVAAQIIGNMNPALREALDQISYAPIAVAGLVFKKDAFKRIPDGFGYLIPSKEKKDVLGVLIESNVFSGRAGKDEIMLRVMLGGAHHPGIINDGPEQILSRVTREIDTVYGLFSNPVESFVKLWPKAIPQYEMNYPRLRQSIAQESQKTPGLHLCANYLDGISFNDCINNAKIIACQST